MTTNIDEEGKALLRRIVERQAYRQVVAIDILGHCLKYVVELDDKIRVTRELDASLAIFVQVRDLYRQLGWEDLGSVVRERLGTLPFPETRVEFAVCRYLNDVAEQVVMESYVDSASTEFAEIARSYLGLVESVSANRAGRFVEFCADRTNLPRAQQLFNKWLAVALLSFGRPHTRGDQRTVELGLRSRRSAEMVEEFLGEVGSFCERCGLTMPDGDALGLELPGDSAGSATDA